MVRGGVSPEERRRSSFVVRAGCAGDGVLRGRTKPAVFLDRDGVLNEEGGYVAKRRDFHWMPAAERAVRAMVRDGFRVLVVTNQGAVGRGLMREETVGLLGRWMAEQIRISGVYYCPHGVAEGCPGMKPGVKLLEAATADWRTDLSRSVLIGDRDTDLEAAAGFGVPGFLYEGGSLFQFWRAIRAIR